MKTVGILGLGQVGHAIKECAVGKFEVLARDLSFDEIGGETVDILHICVPYTDTFVKEVSIAITEIKPKLVIIDASVKPGTTRKIFKKTGVPTVHTPIDGVHPNLARYQTMFAKIIGALDDASFRQAKAHWMALGAPKVVRFNSPEDSELAKLLSTTYYGWNIIFMKAVKSMCEKTGTNFDQVYTQFNEIYNEGYATTLPQVRRPVLTYMPGPIGGHCVMPNIEILREIVNNPELALMVEQNSSYKDGKK